MVTAIAYAHAYDVSPTQALLDDIERTSEGLKWLEREVNAAIDRGVPQPGTPAWELVEFFVSETEHLTHASVAALALRIDYHSPATHIPPSRETILEILREEVLPQLEAECAITPADHAHMLTKADDMQTSLQQTRQARQQAWEGAPVIARRKLEFAGITHPVGVLPT